MHSPRNVFHYCLILIAVTGGGAGCQLPDGTSTLGSVQPVKQSQKNAPAAADGSSYSSITGTGPVVANGMDTSVITIKLHDGSDQPTAGVTPVFEATDTSGGNTYLPCSASGADGISTCGLRSTHGELKALKIRSPVSKLGDSVLFNPAPKIKVVFTTPPTDTQYGVTFAPAPVVEIQNPDGNRITTGADASALVTLSIQSGTGTLSGTVSRNASGGIANFSGSGLSIDQAGTKVLRATKANTAAANGTASVFGDSDPFNIISGSAVAAGSSITGTTPVVADGAASSVIKITLKDSGGNPVIGVAPTFTATDTNSTNLYGTCPVTDSLGVATCALRSTYAEVKTLSIATPVVKTGNAVTFNAGPAAQLIFTTQPPTSSAGTAFSPQPKVAIQDANGNPIGSGPDATAGITLNLQSGTGVLSGTATMSAVAGVADFVGKGLSINLSGAKTLAATKAATAGAGVLVASSALFNINAGPAVAANSSINGTGPVLANGVAASTVTIALGDAFGNPVVGVTPTFSATNTLSHNSYGACSPGDASGSSSCTLKSSYSEPKVLSLTAPVAKTGGTVSFTSGGLNLISFVELLDLGVSSNTSATAFARSRTSLNTGDYDGTVTYFFEIVGQNNDAVGRGVDLIDSAGTVVATATLLASDTTPTRTRSLAFTPTAGANNYRVSLPATASPGQVQIYTARIVVQQAAATQTKLYIPLLDGDTTTVSGSDTTATDSTSSTTYTQATATAYPIWLKYTTALADIAAGTPWTLESVLFSNGAGTSASAALYNRSTNQPVTGAAVSVTGTTPLLSSVDFSNTATNFTSMQEFELRIKASAGTASIARAGLWVRLTNLTKGEIFYRICRSAVVNASTLLQHGKALLDSSQFSGPLVYLEATGSSTGSGSSELHDGGANDSGTTGGSVAGGNVPFGGFSRSRTSALNMNPGDRYFCRVVRSSGITSQTHSSVVVDFSQ